MDDLVERLGKLAAHTSDMDHDSAAGDAKTIIDALNRITDYSARITGFEDKWAIQMHANNQLIKKWQKGNRKPDAWPDRETLLEWFYTRITTLEAEVKRLREYETFVNSNWATKEAMGGWQILKEPTTAQPSPEAVKFKRDCRGCTHSFQEILEN